MFAVLALATLLPLVAAHGSLNFAVINGVTYEGPLPGSDFGPSPIRAINSVDPFHIRDTELHCGHGARPAALVADANPGSIMKFSWRNGETGPWIHEVGPVLTYMAPCGAAGCTNFDSAGAEFFKIGQLGIESENPRVWAMKTLTTSADATLSATLPSDLPAGEYLVRHELLGMHMPGNPESYAVCIQIRLAPPSGNPIPMPPGVRFPGAYNESDPGIKGNAYDVNEAYTFPQPLLFDDPTATGSPPSPGSSSTSTRTRTRTRSGTATVTQTRTAVASPTSGCGNHNNKKKKRVVKRVVRHVIERRSMEDEPPVKREAVAAQVLNSHHARVDQENNIARSRVMRGVF